MEDNRIYEKYKPLSVWVYVGFQILFALPTIGLLLVIVFSIVGDNINMKNLIIILMMKNQKFKLKKLILHQKKKQLLKKN